MRKVLAMLLLAAALGGCRWSGLTNQAAGVAGAKGEPNPPSASSPARPRPTRPWMLVALAAGAALGEVSRRRKGN